MEGRVPDCGIEVENNSKGRRCKIRPSKPRVRSLREQSFQISGPKLFNKMPSKIRNMTKCTEIEFKEALDSFLTRIPDEPRAPGLVPGAMTEDCRMTNSLLGQVDRARREGMVTMA